MSDSSNHSKQVVSINDETEVKSGVVSINDETEVKSGVSQSLRVSACRNIL